MKIKLLESRDDFAKLLLEDTSPAYANALRRVLLSDVPKMAIEDVEFHLGPIRAEDGKEYESVSPLFDEIVAHRLGLLPIPTDLSLYNPRAGCPSCNGEGCPSCTIIYSLNKRGPSVVTSGDLEPIGDEKLRIKDPNIPIVKLGEGQAMLVYATAVLGTGKEHAKWQATHGVSYRYYPTLKIGSKSLDPLAGDVPYCPSHMETSSTEERAVELSTNCATCRAFREAYKADAVKVGNDPTRVLMEFETDGSLRAPEVLVAALDILSKRFSELATQAVAIE